MRPWESLSRRDGVSPRSGAGRLAEPGCQGGPIAKCRRRGRSHSREGAETAGRQGPRRHRAGGRSRRVEGHGRRRGGHANSPPAGFVCADASGERSAILRVLGSFGFRRRSGSFGLPRLPRRDPRGSMRYGNSTPFPPPWPPRSEVVLVVHSRRAGARFQTDSLSRHEAINTNALLRQPPPRSGDSEIDANRLTIFVVTVGLGCEDGADLL